MLCPLFYGGIISIPWSIVSQVWRESGYQYGQFSSTKSQLYASIIVQGSWIWPRQQNVVIQEIMLRSNLIPNGNIDDRVIWSLTPKGIFPAFGSYVICRIKGGLVLSGLV